MKTPEEMKEFFRSMPSKRRENPYWEFNKEDSSIRQKYKTLSNDSRHTPLTLDTAVPLLNGVKKFFRNYYESFHSEAQVLCVTPEDAIKLNNIGVPVLLEKGMIGLFPASVVVLPQDNYGGTSRIGEPFWQNQIIGNNIHPIARIHSHHVLDPYQSMTDYSTLNSGTLEMVLGKIYEEKINICYWLDVPGTDIKAQTFVARQRENDTFEIVPYRFHGKEPENIAQ